MFSTREQDILESLRSSDPGSYPFNTTDQDLEDIFKAIKRERGNSYDQAKRKVRVAVANKFGWSFALDGGFMPNKNSAQYGNKFWPDSQHYTFGQIYTLFENIVIYFINRGYMLEDLMALAAKPPALLVESTPGELR